MSILLAGRYEIIQELDRGSFGVTYLAKDHHKPSKSLCVVKELHTIHKNDKSVLKSLPLPSVSSVE